MADVRGPRQLAEHQVTSFQEVVAISDYFARQHAKAHAPANDDNPSAGYIN